jgi:hypothetical protein
MAFTFSPVTNKFVPRVGQTYRFIGVPAGTHPNLALLVGRRVWAGNKSDKARLAINNVFAKASQAKAVRAKIVQALKDAQRA